MSADRVFKLILSYDGSDFRGWQGLAGKGRSVQESVERALERVVGHKVELAGAGRTDAGVHAIGQVASFHSPSPSHTERIMTDLNALLPSDIVCLSCEEADSRFHARYRALEKTYRYRILNQELPDPFLRRYSLHVPSALNLQAMRDGGAVLRGKHNFQSFTNLKEKEKSFDREIFSVDILKEGPLVDIFFRADGFLNNQARIMASALISCGLGRMGAGELKETLQARDRARAPGAAGPFALCLMEVGYPKD